MAQPNQDQSRQLASVWPSARQRSTSHEPVLEAILATIRERGVERTRFQDVAELSGTSISTLQYLFGSRDAMLVAGFRHGVERDLTYLDRIAAGEGGPWDRLVLMVKALVGDEGDLSASRVEWLELWRASLRDPELFDACAAVYKAWRERFRDVIEDGVVKGVFQLRGTHDSIIAMLFGIVDGLTVPILLNLKLDRDEVTRMVVTWLATVLNVVPADGRPVALKTSSRRTKKSTSGK
jgi:AcrR family transcriptional regulator